MGTSSSYGGPIGLTPLLPPWADEALEPLPERAPGEERPQQGQNEPQPPLPEVSWRSPKTVMSHLARSANDPTHSQLASLGRSYVRARGGARTAARTSTSGRTTLGALGGFLASGIREGFGRAAEHFGLAPLIGQDLQSFLYGFVEMLAPDGSLLEEAAARSALLQTLEVVFEEFDWEGNALETFENVNIERVQEIIQLYVSKYVNVRIQQELANRVERGTKSERDANRLMDDIAGFIAEVIQLDFGTINVLEVNWDGPAGREVILNIYEMAYQLIGGE